MTGKNPKPKDHNKLRILFWELKIQIRLEIQILQEKLCLLACQKCTKIPSLSLIISKIKQ